LQGRGGINNGRISHRPTRTYTDGKIRDPQFVVAWTDEMRKAAISFFVVVDVCLWLIYKTTGN